MLSSKDQALLRAVIDRIVPADDFASATGFGADAFVLGILETDARAVREPIVYALRDLDRAGFLDADPTAQDGLLAPHAASAWFLALTELTQEGVYADPANGGNRDTAAWRMIRYEHRLPDGPSGPPRQPDPPVAVYGPSGVAEWDVLVIGGGAGGGTCASELAAQGKRVLVVERGRWRDYANSGHRDHLRNHRNYPHGHNTGPELEGNPRIFVDPLGDEHLVAPHRPGYQPLASAVGGGTLVYGMQSWRFHPLDFRMASTYGVPEGSSLADWPLDYDELAPWYDRAEWEIGVAGPPGGDPNGGPRSRDFPMPPVPGYGSQHVLKRGADALGLKTFTLPLAVNTIARDGRGKCIECASCVGFPCPTNAKNGTQNTVLRRALAAGNLTLVTGAVAERIATDDNGRAIGADIIHDDGRRETIRAATVVVAASAIETARLLLASPTAREPNGLGNNSDHVGRHLQGHQYPTALGLFDEEVVTSRGPGATIATTDYNHGNPGIVGGGMLADDFLMTPVAFWQAPWPARVPRWGQGAKTWMRTAYRHVTQARGPVQDIPSPHARVELAPHVRDSRGRAVVRMSGTVHAETVRTCWYMRDRAIEWLTAAGAREIWSPEPVLAMSGHQHQAGTARMSARAEDGVTDKWGRVWGHDNLFIADGAVHVTNGGYNPVLTIMALGLRSGDHIARSV